MDNLSQNTGDIFEEKYKMYGNMLFKLSMVYLYNHADAEEAVQEAFIRLIYKSPEFKNTEHEKSWLLRITINLCKDKLKSYWKRNIFPLDEIQDFIDSEDDIKFSQLIFSLPPKYRTVIHLYYYEDYGISEIAKILHISQSAVKMRLKRGREFLKLELEDDVDEKAGL